VIWEESVGDCSERASELIHPPPCNHCEKNKRELKRENIGGCKEREESPKIREDRGIVKKKGVTVVVI